MAAPVIVQSAFSNSSLSLAFSSNTTAGNYIAVWWWAPGAAGQPSVSDSQSNTYTPRGGTSGSGAFQGFATATGIAGGACTVSLTTLGANGMFIIMEVSGATGIETSAPFGLSTTGSPVSVGPITTTQANDLILMGGGTNGAGTLSNANSWPTVISGTRSTSGTDSCIVFSHAQGSAGSISNSFATTTGGNFNIGSSMIGLKGSGAAPGSGMIVNPGLDGNMRPQLKGGMNG